MFSEVCGDTITTDVDRTLLLVMIAAEPPFATADFPEFELAVALPGDPDVSTKLLDRADTSRLANALRNTALVVFLI